ncbi:FkbM family methyltransferase [Patescibacteria group bacterium]|nr:MAG: FkbM family methyltransferase [Patescibacteria group bacterium]
MNSTSATSKLKDIIGKVVLALVPKAFIARLFFFVSQADGSIITLSYAQDAEDLLVSKIFENQPSGLYLDIGAYHPKRFSNTFQLFTKGWHGINVDPFPGVKKLFDLARPKDVNLEMGISESSGSMLYHVFDQQGVNTFDEKRVETNIANGFKKRGTLDIPVDTLRSVLSKHAQKQKIDLMTIDVEGHELPILRSNDWSQFSPRVIVIEMMRQLTDPVNNPVFHRNGRQVWYDCTDVNEDPVHQFLTQQGYRLFAKSTVSMVYVHKLFDDGK